MRKHQTEKVQLLLQQNEEKEQKLKREYKEKEQALRAENERALALLIEENEAQEALMVAKHDGEERAARKANELEPQVEAEKNTAPASRPSVPECPVSVYLSIKV